MRVKVSKLTIRFFSEWGGRNPLYPSAIAENNNTLILKLCRIIVYKGVKRTTPLPGESYKKYMKKEELKQALYDMALEIAKLKEAECGNSGHNWLNRFIRDYGLLDETEFINN